MKKILIFESDPYYSVLMETALRSSGYDVEITSNPDEAKRKAGKKPSLIILSLDTQGGFKLFNTFKSSEEFRSIPVLIISSFPIKENPTTMLVKPFTDEVLVEKVQNMIGFTITEEEFIKIQENLLILAQEKADAERRVTDLERELERVREEKRRILDELKKIIEKFSKD